MGVGVNEQRMSQSELESYLWGAAVLLRGLIDAGEYKGYIFPLVFLKRISDVWDEEQTAALEMYDGDEELAALPENHRFAVPDSAHWEDVRATTSNVGRKLVTAMRAIESANPDTLNGVFGDAEWTNKDLLSDSTLTGLVEHFSACTLSLTNLPEDELGNGYEYLIKRFADDSGHTAQEFYTNRTLVHLMARMLKAQPGESVYDPTCGTGGMLISCAAELRAQGKEHRTLRLYGQERNFATSAIAKMNLFLHGVEDGHVAHGDTLANPHFLNKSGQLEQFDVVLANPPYSIKNWDREAFTNDPFGRNMWGVPPQNSADYTFIQHIATSMDPKTGRSAILLPHGVLERRSEVSVRRAMVESGMLEAVLGLGGGLFYNSAMEAVVVILRPDRPEEQRDQVLFINAVDLVARERAQSFLRPEHQQEILAAYEGFTDVAGLAAVVDRERIAANEYSLSIPLYVAVESGDSDFVSLEDAVAQWREAANVADTSVASLLASLRGEDSK